MLDVVITFLFIIWGLSIISFILSTVSENHKGMIASAFMVIVVLLAMMFCVYVDITTKKQEQRTYISK